jgi:sirohydrochlorin ferrochelatase
VTRLVTVAHGTRHAPGNEVARTLTARAGARLGLPATCSYVELCAPLFGDVVAGSAEPTAVVPLLLSTGHHLRHDLPSAVAGAAGVVSLGPSLGPDPLLAVAQAARLVAAGALPGQPVVMVAAGSNDPLAMRDLTRAAELLDAAWGGPVVLTTLGGHGRRPAEVVGPEHAVSPYLLADGHFAQRTRSECAGADVVAEVIGPHERVVDLVVQRAEGLLAERRSA